MCIEQEDENSRYYDDRRYEPTQADFDAMALDRLAAEVGGDHVLDALDDAPIPDEPFDWTGIADDVVPIVGEILAHVDRCCDDLLDLEYRTACRRLLARAAVGDPRVFRRKAKSETAAAAIVWIVGRANQIFEGPQRLMLASRVADYLGVKGSASGRAESMLRAARFGSYFLDFRLDADYLVSARRRAIIEERNRYAPPPPPCPQCPYVRDADLQRVRRFETTAAESVAPPGAFGERIERGKYFR